LFLKNWCRKVLYNSTWLRIRQLEREKTKAFEDFRRRANEARRRGERIDDRAIQAEEIGMYHEYQAPIEALLTERLIRKARRFEIDVPDDEDAWGRSDFTLERFLTRKARRDLVKKIRDEKKELSQLYLPWVMAVIALVSLMVAFISVLKR
jgi:hypothetical protein